MVGKESDDGSTRFENVLCHCNRRARIKIAVTERSKGRLYYLCDRVCVEAFLDGCTFSSCIRRNGQEEGKHDEDDCGQEISQQSEVDGYHFVRYCCVVDFGVVGFEVEVAIGGSV